MASLLPVVTTPVPFHLCEYPRHFKSAFLPTAGENPRNQMNEIFHSLNKTADHPTPHFMNRLPPQLGRYQIITCIRLLYHPQSQPHIQITTFLELNSFFHHVHYRTRIVIVACISLRKAINGRLYSTHSFCTIYTVKIRTSAAAEPAHSGAILIGVSICCSQRTINQIRPQ